MADQLRRTGVTMPRVEDPSNRQSAMVIEAQTEKFVDMTSSYVLKQESKSQLERSLFDLKSQRLRNPASSLIFSRNGGVDSLLQLSRSLQKKDEGDCSLLGLVWGTLANLCAFDEETRRKVLSAISEICEILTNCPYPKVVNTTCRTLGNLTSSTRFTQSCQGNEITMIREITRILNSIQDSGCLQSTLRALRKLCSNGVLNEELRLTQSFAAVATTLSLNDTSVTVAALRTFETLTSSHGNCDLIPDLWMVSDNTPLRLLVQLVSQNNIGCPSVDMAIALLGRCVRHVDGKAALSRAGGIEVMVNILMQETDWKCSGIYAEILDMLCLCCRDVHGRQKMRDSSGLQLLIKLLHNDEFKGCHEDLLSALICYYFDEHTLRYMVSQLGLMKSLTHHLVIITKGLKEERSSIIENDWPRGGDMDDGDGLGSVVSSLDDRKDFETSLSAVDSDVDQSSLLSFATEYSLPDSPSTAGTGIECTSQISQDTKPQGICSPVFNPNGFIDIGAYDGVKTGTQVSTPLLSEDNFVQSSSSQHTPSSRHRIVAIDVDQLTPVPVNFIDSILSSPTCSPAISSPLPRSSIHLLSDTQDSLESKVLLLISRLSHLHVCQPILATAENLSSILDYFLTSDSSNCTQTFKILGRLFVNPLCFQDCLKTHASSLIFKHMCSTIPTTTASISDQQQTYSLQVMCTELFDKLSHVASSPYGQGVVAHMLLRGNEKEVVAGTLALSLLRKSRVVCHKMLINYNGLHNLFHLVQGQSLSREHSPAFDAEISESVSNDATMTLLLLANTYYAHPINKRRRSSAFPSEYSDNLFPALPTKKARLETPADSNPITDMLSSFPLSNSFTNKGDYMCRYMDTDHCPFDLLLVVGDEERSCRFPVHRHRFVEACEVFAVMLEGLYQESQLGRICIREVNPSVFRSYVHHVYGCRWPCEVEREEWRKECLKSDEIEIDSGNALNYDLLKELIESVTLPCIRIQEFVHYLLLLECANRYYLPSLISRCEDVLASYVTAKNLVPMFMYASIHQGHRLCRKCVIELVSLGDVEKQCVVMRDLLSSSDALNCLDIIKDFFHVH